MTARAGNWMQTVGGRAFFPLDPRPEDIDIGDIAHSLALICRFGGHCLRFYSVADHSVRVALAIRHAGGTVMEQREGLLHDAAEAYVGDMVWPIKQAPELAGYKDVERGIEYVIADRFRIPRTRSPIVKHFDLVLLSTEKRDLMRPGVGRENGAKREGEAARAELGAWHADAWEPLRDTIEPLPPELARERFLEHFSLLGGNEVEGRGATLTGSEETKR